MKKTVITYLIFILAMTAFVTLRVYAGRAIAADAATPEPESENLTDSYETLADTLDKMKDKEPEEKTDTYDEDEYLWHGDITPEKDFTGLLPRIVCWGDSLTVSLDGKSAFPDILRSLSGCEVVNYGVEAENTAMIAMREGGLRVNVKATVIPADVTLIPVFLRTENNGHVYFLDNGDGGVNPCRIGGIEGELQKLNGSYYFKRSAKGERTAIDEGTQFETFGMTDSKPEDVLVIFAGTNDLPNKNSVRNIIELERSMLDAAGSDKYIIVGLTYAGGIPEIDEVNLALEKEFGDHFVDIRKYMLSYGLEDSGITPTAEDEADIKKGEIPSSLRKDYVHGNKHYHRLLGEQIYRRMQYLGYIPQGSGQD
ncbi:MAG: SGNH/GDSL hydrolase family protein [Lachnospiraceae bacterium]|nr:SGNH/GDSL hydrolase family protein [Lachnospiraceae bacterium]